MNGSTSNVRRRAFSLRRWPAIKLAVLSLVFSPACGAPSITVPTGPHRPQLEEAPLPVLKPPPSAKIEVVPLRRNEGCFYLDGYYKPLGDTWTWEKGKWVMIPDDCYFAPPITHYEMIEGGTTLVYREGVWLRKSAKARKCGQPSVCPPVDRKLH